MTPDRGVGRQVQVGKQTGRQTDTCLRGKPQEKKTISVSLTVQFTVRTSPCFSTLLDTVRSTSMTFGTEIHRCTKMIQVAGETGRNMACL